MYIQMQARRRILFCWQPGRPHPPDQVTGLHIMKVSKLAKSILAAAHEYIALRDRSIHPVGTFDSAGRFYLATRCECCRSIKSPSRAYPFSHMVHARSIVHVAHAAGLAGYVKAVRRVADAIEKDGSVPDKDYFLSESFLKLLADCANAEVVNA